MKHFFFLDLHFTRIHLPSLWWQKTENVAFSCLSSIVHLHQNFRKFTTCTSGVYFVHERHFTCPYLMYMYNVWIVRVLDKGGKKNMVFGLYFEVVLKMMLNDNAWWNSPDQA